MMAWSVFVCRAFLFALILHSRITTGLLLLSDLPTPAFLVDVGWLQQQLGKDTPIGPVFSHGHTFVPAPLANVACPHVLMGQTAAEVASPHDDNTVLVEAPGFAYWHASVVRPRETEDDTSFLALLDLPVGVNDATLCLGLNNHHVVSYYWARSAGAGAMMVAPGIRLTQSQLQWESTQGPAGCNSNDGKRSEWANFLRKGDQVQLVPKQPTRHMVDWLEQQSEQPERIVYGISRQDRPMGSEPAVVCQWKCL